MLGMAVVFLAVEERKRTSQMLGPCCDLRFVQTQEVRGGEDRCEEREAAFPTYALHQS